METEPISTLVRTEADAHFVKGYSHKACEDYAMTGNNAIVVSDGCSSADYSDIGARLLSLAVMSSIKKSRGVFNLAMPNLVYGELNDSVRKHLEDYPTIADATYISAHIDNHFLAISARGDGAIYIEYHNGYREYIELKYPSGYPNYLSYELDKDRQTQYLQLREGIAHLHIDFTILKGGEQDNSSIIIPTGKFNTAIRLEDNIKLVAVMSDGVYSFSDLSGVIPSIKVIEQLTSFKSFKGDFVQRRFQGFERFCKENSWSHYDDVSMAAMYIPEIK